MLYFDMGIEDNEDGESGEIYFNAVTKLPRGTFYMGVLNDDRFDKVYIGSIIDLGESFIVNGVAKMLVAEGIDVYFFFNPDDLEDENISREILPKGMTYRKDY